MPQEDPEDLNVMNLTETKSQRTPHITLLDRLKGNVLLSRRAHPNSLPAQPMRTMDFTPALVIVMGALLAVAVIYRLSATPSDAA